MMDKHYIIYKTTNLLNGRYYIGMHITPNIDDGYLGSGRRIKAEIKKYGRKNFSREVLENLSSREELVLRESAIVTEELRSDPLCLNLKNGGEGGWEFVNETRTPEQLTLRAKKARAKSSGRSGMKCSDELKQRISDALTGRPNWSPGTTGKTFTKKIKPFGKSNSQYGTCWVTLNGVSKKIKKDLLEAFLLEGYSRGRTMPA